MQTALLAQRGGKVGLTGFCMGGAVTVIGAVHIHELSAAVCFYGLPPENVVDPRDIHVPFQGHHAFMNSERATVYGAEAAQQAWDRLVAFFRRHLA